MKKYLKVIKHYIPLISLIFIVFFLLTFFSISTFYNHNYSYYQIEVKKDFDVNYVFNEGYFKRTIEKIDEHNLYSDNKISYANIEYIKMLEDIKIIESDNQYTILIKSKYFTDIVKNSNGIVKSGTDRCIDYIEKILKFNTIELNYVKENKVEVVGYVNPYIISPIVGVSFALLYIVFIVLYAKKNKEITITDISNGETIFKNPFNKKYWNLSKNCFNKVKNLTNIAILFSLLLIGKLISLPSGFGDLGISFTYIIFSIISMLYGPICGIVIGALSDILGHFMFQGGTVFFLGYTVSAMLAGLVYGLCFYRTKVTFTKCLTARIIVNMFINVVLGTIWWSMVYDLPYDATMTYLYTIALPKNIIYLLPQSIVLYIIMKALAGPLKMFNLLDEEIADNITIL